MPRGRRGCELGREFQRPRDHWVDAQSSKFGREKIKKFNGSMKIVLVASFFSFHVVEFHRKEWILLTAKEFRD
jgi:hypothetical protein